MLHNCIEKYILLHYLIIFLLGYGDYRLNRLMLYSIQENLIVINFDYFTKLLEKVDMEIGFIVDKCVDS